MLQMPVLTVLGRWIVICRFQIHTVQTQTFHSRCSKCPPCTVTQDAALIIS
jgi:hypothetical protein